MSFKIVLGGSGSGKTHNIYSDCISRSLEKPEEYFIIIVPEQYTMQTQKDIVKLHPDHATENIDVMSFNRLAYRIFNELGISNPEIIDDIGKSMIIKRVAQNNKDKLGLWKKQFEKSGFVSNIKSIISELYQYGVTPEDIEGLSNKELKPVVNDKLSDIYLIYKGFADYISDKYITTEEILDVLCSVLNQSELLKNATIYLDGFTGFTPVQYKIIKEFFLYSKQVIFSITIADDENPLIDKGASSLFAMSTDMIKRINSIAIKSGCEFVGFSKQGSRPYMRYQHSPELDFFEQHFLRYDRCVYNEIVEAIKIYNARTPNEEVQLVSNTIAKYIKQYNLRYRDIAIICGDLDGYYQSILSELTLHEIPYYVDNNLDISKNIFPEFIRAAINCVTEEFSYESVIRYLKTDMVTNDYHMINLLDNYLLEVGLKGINLYKKHWDYIPNDLKDIDIDRLNEFKDKIIDDLNDLHQILNSNTSTVGTIIEAILVLIKKLDIEQKLKKYEEQFLDNQDMVKAKEYEKVYDEIINLLNKMNMLLGDQILSKEDFNGILDSGLEQVSVGMIPASADKVFVGDITRSRIDEVKVLFLIGANDGIIPNVKSNSNIFTDRERQELKKIGIELAPTIKEDLFIQRYYLYRMLTKPSFRLIVSCSAMDFSGKSLRESSIIKQIEKLYSNNIRCTIADSDIFYSDIEIKRYFIKQLQNINEDNNIFEGEVFKKVYLYLSKNHKEDTDKLINAATFAYQGDSIGKEAARQLYQEDIVASVTRLEQFSNCEYAHFLKYGLKLSERKIRTIQSVDIGNLIHSTLEKTFSYAKQRNMDIATMDTIQRDKLVEACAMEAILDDLPGKYTESGRNQYITHKLTVLSQKTAMVLSKQLEAGDFVPYAFELPFSLEDRLSSLDFHLSEKERIRLIGKIDRVDICDIEDKLLVKIVDYKTGSTKWDYSSVVSGTQIQLVTYLNAVIEMLQKQNNQKKVLPAAMFYYNIDNPILNFSDINEISNDIVETKNNIEQSLIRSLRPNGIINSDMNIIKCLDRDINTASDVIPVVIKKEGLSNKNIAGTERFNDLMKYVNRNIKVTAEKIFDGSISVNPISKDSNSTSCTWCPYSAVCGFDRKTDGYKYRNVAKYNQEDFWKMICGENDGIKTN